ncbi:MAG: cobalt ECF transporter T component CbiQ, partial [Desulfatiglandales bacterium]
MFEADFLSNRHFLRRLDPRFKIFAYLALAFEITLLETVTVSMAVFLGSVLFVLLSKITPSEIIKRMVAVNLFVLFFWVVLPFTYPGESIFRYSFLNVTREGLIYSLLITLKCNSAFLLLFSLVGSITSAELGQALISLRLSPKLTYLILFTWRYLSVMWMELNIMTRSLKARSFEPKNNLFTYRTLAFMVGMLMIRAYERSRRVKWAMEARGFEGRFYSLRGLCAQKRDWAFGAISFLFVAIL